MTIKDANLTRPGEVKMGDVFIKTVVLRVKHHADSEGRPYYKMYLCPYNGIVGEDGTPQGHGIFTATQEMYDLIAETLFPVITRNLAPDPQ